MKALKLAVVAGACALSMGAIAQTQGVSQNEIVLGSIQDLSGPIAGFGKQARLGFQMRTDEINEAGGIHGRKIKLIFEDAAYDPRKAVLAAQKLVNQDKIFAMLGHIGTAHNLAAMPVQFEKNVLNFMPLTAAREMYEPLHRLKYSNFAPYFDQMKLVVPMLIKEKKATKICTIYQDDEFGLEIVRGTEEGLKTINMALHDRASFKRGATDFSSQVAKVQASGCDFIAMGTLIRETIGTIGTARKLGYNPIFVGSSGAYTDLIHKLGGAAMNGFYAGHTIQHPYMDEAEPKLRAWAEKYKAKFNEEPTVFSAYGYLILDTFQKAAEKTGPNLTTDTFVKTMESFSMPPDMFGSDATSFTATKHLGSDRSRLSQIVDGRWKVIQGYTK